MMDLTLKFTPESAFNMSLLAELAYPNLGTPEKFGFNAPTMLIGKETDTQGYVTHDNERMIIAFSGTESWTDIIVNLKIALSPLLNLTGVKVHSGFYKAYQSIHLAMYEDMHKRFDSTPSIRQIYFTGHSLGGAVACVAALKCMAFIMPQWAGNCAVYTFGCPRIGNGAFSSLFNSIITTAHRVVLADDPVTRLPGSWISNYSHVGRTIHIDNEGNELGIISGLRSALRGSIIDIDDHKLTNYQKALCNMRSKPV